MTTRTGPNDARRVVWAISKLFFNICVFFSLQFVSIGTSIIDVTNELERHLRLEL